MYTIYISSFSLVSPLRLELSWKVRHSVEADLSRSFKGLALTATSTDRFSKTSKQLAPERRPLPEALSEPKASKRKPETSLLMTYYISPIYHICISYIYIYMYNYIKVKCISLLLRPPAFFSPPSCSSGPALFSFCSSERLGRPPRKPPTRMVRPLSGSTAAPLAQPQPMALSH